MPYLLILRIKTAYNMRLKIVLHIKIQFVSSDFMVVNKTHFKRHAGNGHSRLPSATSWSFYATAGIWGRSKHCFYLTWCVLQLHFCTYNAYMWGTLYLITTTYWFYTQQSANQLLLMSSSTLFYVFCGSGQALSGLRKNSDDVIMVTFQFGIEDIYKRQAALRTGGVEH